MGNGKSDLSVIGFNHKSAGIVEREAMQISRKEIPAALKLIFSIEGVEGIAIVTTCNRIEFYLVHTGTVKPFDIIKKFYSEYKSIDILCLGPVFFNRSGEDATRHLFEVICGMDSLILGEYQIQGQIKEAYSKACEAKTLEKILHKLFHAAFRAGKRVRSETSFGSGRQSVSGAAAQIMIEKIKPGDNVVIIGVNENTRILSAELAHAGFGNFTFLNRTVYKAQMMAEEYGGNASGLDNLEKALFFGKAVFTCTGATSHIISVELLRKLIIQERYPRLIIDMAVPRDVESVLLPPNISYFDIGRLQDYLENQQNIQSDALPAAKKIIGEETAIFQAWSETQSNDILKPFAEKFEIIRQQILDEQRDSFPEQTFEKVDRLTRSLLHQLQSTFVRILVKQSEK